MAVLDTHKAFEHLRAAGYSKEMAEALLDTLGNSQDTLATKSDLHELAQETKTDLRNLVRAIATLEQAVNKMASKAELRELEHSIRTSVRELELRMTVKVGAMLFAVAGPLVALELIPR